jgi:hypothetical protein
MPTYEITEIFSVQIGCFRLFPHLTYFHVIMGSGLTKHDALYDVYMCRFQEDGTAHPEPEIIEMKKNLLTKSNSHPDLLTSSTVFTPYIDVKVKQKETGSHSHIHRAVPTIKKSIIGDGKLNYKKFEYFEIMEPFPWILKNAHFLRPTMKDFKVERAIGRIICLLSFFLLSFFLLSFFFLSSSFLLLCRSWSYWYSNVSRNKKW